MKQPIEPTYQVQDYQELLRIVSNYRGLIHKIFMSSEVIHKQATIMP